MMQNSLTFHFHSASVVWHPKTRAYVRLLGPCFKTGRLKPFRQHKSALSAHSPTHRSRRITCNPTLTIHGFMLGKFTLTLFIWSVPTERHRARAVTLYRSKATFPNPLSRSQNWCWLELVEHKQRIPHKGKQAPLKELRIHRIIGPHRCPQPPHCWLQSLPF